MAQSERERESMRYEYEWESENLMKEMKWNEREVKRESPKTTSLFVAWKEHRGRDERRKTGLTGTYNKELSERGGKEGRNCSTRLNGVWGNARFYFIRFLLYSHGHVGVWVLFFAFFGVTLAPRGPPGPSCFFFFFFNFNQSLILMGRVIGNSNPLLPMQLP